MTQQPAGWPDEPPASAPPTTVVLPTTSPVAPSPVAPALSPVAPGPVASALSPVAPRPHRGRWTPARVEAVAGTEFGLVHLEVAPVTSGFAVGSLMAGVAAVFVSLLVVCLGMLGVGAGWGAWVAGAFTVLGVVAGGGAVGLGAVALRQIRRSSQSGSVRFIGRGLAVAGLCCGGVGLAVSVLSLALVVLVQVL